MKRETVFKQIVKSLDKRESTDLVDVRVKSEVNKRDGLGWLSMYTCSRRTEESQNKLSPLL